MRGLLRIFEEWPGVLAESLFTKPVTFPTMRTAAFAPDRLPLQPIWAYEEDFEDFEEEDFEFDEEDFEDFEEEDFEDFEDDFEEEDFEDFDEEDFEFDDFDDLDEEETF